MANKKGKRSSAAAGAYDEGHGLAYPSGLALQENRPWLLHSVRSTVKLLLLSLFWLIPVLACNATDQLLDQNESLVPADSDVDRNKAIYLSGGQPRTLDPAMTHGGAYGPVGGIFSGLVTLNSDLQVQPELAHGWEVSDDGTLYTFYIRPDARFHDGRPVTAQDFVYSWERAANPLLGSDTVQTYLGDVVGIDEVISGGSDHISGLRVVDDHTLEVRIDAPKAYFLSKLTYPVAYVVDKENVDRLDWEHDPNGTGAFELQEWEDDEYIILRRNDGYNGLPPAIDHLVYLMGAGIPLSMYEKGEIDVVGVGGSNLERVQDPNNPLHQDLRVGVDMCTSYVVFNSDQAPFNDPLVRQAFSYALDKERIVDGLFMGDALVAEGPLPPGMPGYTGDLDGYNYNPEKAKETLARAGYDDPSSLPAVTFNTSGYGSVGPYVTSLISMWQETLGVTIEPILLDPYLFIDELYSGNTGDIFLSGWCADYPDPENFLDLLYHSTSKQNLGSYNNPAIDGLLEEARIEPDVGTRMDQYAEIERMIVEDAPAVFLTHSLAAELVKPYVENYVWTPIGVAQWHQVEIDR
ncbi:MAG: ABC transporter substrate-binding protein [Candidatus Promineifilaceae bacterium]